MQNKTKKKHILRKKTKTKKKNFISSYFPGDSKRIAKVVLNGILKVVLLLEAILLFSNNVTCVTDNVMSEK